MAIKDKFEFKELMNFAASKIGALLMLAKYSTNPIVAGTGIAAGTILPSVTKMISYKNNHTPVEKYIIKFDEVVEECIKRNFEEFADCHEKIKAELDDISGEIDMPEDEERSIKAVKDALHNAGVDVDDNLIKQFLDDISDSMCSKIVSDSDLLNLVMNEAIEDIKQTVGSIENISMRTDERTERIEDSSKRTDERTERIEDLGEKILDEVKLLRSEVSEKGGLTVTDMRGDNELSDIRLSDWRKPMFLEQKAKNVDISKRSMEQVYVVPDYEMEDKGELSLIDLICTNMLSKRLTVLLGNGGYGKSSLLTYLLWRAAKGELGGIEADKIFIYSFADFKNVDWKQDTDTVLGEMLKAIGSQSVKAMKDSFIFLDGFDEVACSMEKRAEIIQALSEEWCSRCFVLVASRNGCIGDIDGSYADIINLMPFDAAKIDEFANKYSAAVPEKKRAELKYLSKAYKEKLYTKKEITGIPIILYMVLAMEIDVIDKNSEVEIYDSIFNLKKGIYDRVVFSRPYDKKYKGLKDDEKRILHQMSRELALWMFENDNENCPIEVCENIMNMVLAAENKVLDRKISEWLKGSFFKLNHLDGKMVTVRFVHRTMYEYFMAEYICDSFVKACSIERMEEAVNSLHKSMGWILKGKKLIITSNKGISILSYLSKKFNTEFNRNGSIIKERLSNELLEKTLNEMLLEGFAKHYYQNAAVTSFDVIRHWERCCFYNFLLILRILMSRKGHERLFENNQLLVYSFANYIKMNGLNLLFLSDINLSDIDLSGAELSKVIFQNVSINNARLVRTNLRGAEFRNVTINNSDFSYADMELAYFEKSEVKGCNFTGARLGNMVGDINIVRNWSNYFNNTDFACVNNTKYFRQGNLIELGTYPQKRGGNDMSPVLWRVADILGGYTLLVADRVLDTAEYDEDGRRAIWSECSLNDWLNNEFMNRVFNEEVQEFIVEPDEVEKYYPNQFVAGAGECRKLFIFSESELVRYFGYWEYEYVRTETFAGCCSPSVTALGSDYAIYRMAAEHRAVNWWLRDKGNAADRAKYVINGGTINIRGRRTNSKGYGVRPVLWIKSDILMHS